MGFQNELRIGYYASHPPINERDEAQDHAMHKHSPSHMKHCFDYLRQALMCGADTTLEGLRSGPDGVLANVDGWGATHECRNYQEIYDWTMSHRASGSGGIM